MSREAIAGRLPVRAVGARAIVRSLLVALGLALLVFWILFLRPEALGGRASYRPGDIVAYRVPAGDPASGARVIHRILRGSPAAGYVVQGDNKSQPDPWR